MCRRAVVPEVGGSSGGSRSTRPPTALAPTVCLVKSDTLAKLAGALGPVIVAVAGLIANAAANRNRRARLKRILTCCSFYRSKAGPDVSWRTTSSARSFEWLRTMRSAVTLLGSSSVSCSLVLPAGPAYSPSMVRTGGLRPLSHWASLALSDSLPMRPGPDEMNGGVESLSLLSRKMEARGRPEPGCKTQTAGRSARRPPVPFVF